MDIAHPPHSRVKGSRELSVFLTVEKRSMNANVFFRNLPTPTSEQAETQTHRLLLILSKYVIEFIFRVHSRNVEQLVVSSTS